MGNEETKIVIAGLYGLCHYPQIPGMEVGGDWHGAELWTLNDYSHCLAAKFHIPTRIFNLHNNLETTITALGVDFDQHVGREYDMYVNVSGVELWLTEPHPRWPTAKIYPYEKVKKAIGVGDWFFSSSIAYMLALAVYEGYRKITLRCVSMTNDDEYFWQAIGCLYALRHFDKMGIHIDAPHRCIWEERFTEADFEVLESGDNNAAYHVRKSLYRLDRPYHTLDRYEQEECARAALAAKGRTYAK
jgi:hypothetical protein